MCNDDFLDLILLYCCIQEEAEILAGKLEQPLKRKSRKEEIRWIRKDLSKHGRSAQRRRYEIGMSV